jgi:hypothetical protein
LRNRSAPWARLYVSLNTYCSIAAIVVVQLNYAILPRLCRGLFSN